jgi:hypothetical protein
MPPALNVEMAKGFTLYMVQLYELIDLTKTNLWR